MDKKIIKVSLLSSGLFFSSTLMSCGHKIYYHDLKPLAPYMHTVTFDGFVEDVNHETTNFQEDGGCSTIRNGHLFGRNLDYYYTDMPSFLVKMKAGKNRYASLGVSFNNSLHEDEILQAEKSGNSHFHGLEIAPSKTVDGINENGVACCLNVCSLQDTIAISGTNPGKYRLYAPFVCRYILDHATSAKNAIELLENSDIYLDDTDENNYHYMIADKNETYIVELFNNKLKWIKRENTNEPDQIMTNFYNNLNDSEIKATYKEDLPEGVTPTYPNHAKGTERFEKLKNNYQTANTIEEMWAALERIKYSGIYPDHGEEAPLTPDNPSEDFTQIQIYNNEYPGWEKIYKDTRYVLENKRRDLAHEKDVWITIHSSIYDFDDKKLYLVVQEDYTKTYEVDFDSFEVKTVDL